jgi:hypothetical protein
MSDEHFGKKHSIAAIPLEGELHVGSRRGLMAVGISPKPDALAMIGRRVPELKVAYRHVAISDVCPPITDLEPVIAEIAVIGPPKLRLDGLPLVPTLDHQPIGTVDAASVEIRVFEAFEEVARKGDVGIDVEEPIRVPEHRETAFDRPALVEGLAITIEVVRRHDFEVMLVAQIERCNVASARDDDPPGEVCPIGQDRLGQEVIVSHADRDGLDARLHFTICS